MEVDQQGSSGATSTNNATNGNNNNNGNNGTGKSGLLQIKIKHWHAVGKWDWDFSEDTCAICQFSTGECCPICKYPGNSCPPGKTVTHLIHSLFFSFF